MAHSNITIIKIDGASMKRPAEITTNAKEYLKLSERFAQTCENSCSQRRCAHDYKNEAAN